MSEVMLALGEYQFSVNSAEYQELERKHAWRWVSHQRVNQKAAQQFQGPDSSEISLKGTIYVETSEDVKQLDKMKAEGDKGEALRLVSGSAALGRDWGLWCLMNLSEVHRHLLPDGTPLKITFSLRLIEYGADSY